MEAGQKRLQDLRRAPLMRGIAPAMQEADRDGRGRAVDARGGRLHRLFIERRQDGAVGLQALRHFEAQRTRHQGRRSHEARIVEAGQHAPRAADLDGVAKALRRDERDRAALALQQRVGRHRRAVRDAREPLERRHGRAQARHDAVRLIGRRRRHLAERDRAVAIEHHQVGERAPDIDADDQIGHDDTALSVTIAPLSASSRARLSSSRPTASSAMLCATATQARSDGPSAGNSTKPPSRMPSRCAVAGASRARRCPGGVLARTHRRRMPVPAVDSAP